MADHSDDLDQLLDSALDDFQNLNLKPSLQRDKDATESTQEEPPALPSGVQGLGMGLPDLRSKKKGKQKVSKESHVSEAIDKLREQTREAVKGLESLPGAKPSGGDPMMEDWVKQFEELAGSQSTQVKLSSFKGTASKAKIQYNIQPCNMFTFVVRYSRQDLEVACEDFSNIIGSSPDSWVYKGGRFCKIKSREYRKTTGLL